LDKGWTFSRFVSAFNCRERLNATILHSCRPNDSVRFSPFPCFALLFDFLLLAPAKNDVSNFMQRRRVTNSRPKRRNADGARRWDREGIRWPINSRINFDSVSYSQTLNVLPQRIEAHRRHQFTIRSQ